MLCSVFILNWKKVKSIDMKRYLGNYLLIYCFREMPILCNSKCPLHYDKRLDIVFFVAKECSNSLLDPLFFFRTSLLNHLPAWQSFDMRQMPVVAKIRPLKSQSWWWLQLCCGTLLLIKSTDNKNWPSNVKTTWWRKKKGGRMLRKKTFSSCAEKRDITIIIACRAIYT